MSPRAKSLILDLLSTVRRGSVPVRALLRSAELFGIGPNSTRVALARLRASGLVASDERGRYRLGATAQPVQAQVASWRRLDERVRAWEGGWIAAYTGMLGRSDRAALRRRQSALRFLGFRTLEPGLEVRPDNLAADKEPVGETRRRLVGLGLEPAALVCALSDLDPARDRRARTLWDRDGLPRVYRALTSTLARSASSLASLPRERAMVEPFLVGCEAIPLLVFDPLLPDEIVPSEDRQALLEEARAYDLRGREIWSGALELDDPADAGDERAAPADVRGLDAVGALAAAAGA